MSEKPHEANGVNGDAGAARALRELQLLHRVSTLMSSAEPVTAGLQAVCVEMARYLGVPQAGLALLDADGVAAEVVADHHPPDGPSSLGAVIPVADNPAMAYILEHRAPLAIGDAQADPRLARVRNLMHQRSVESILLVPLVADGEVIGTLGFDTFEPHRFPDADVRLAQHVANQVGQLLVRRRAEQALRQSEERWRAYIERANDYIFTLDREGCLTSVNRALCRATGYDASELEGMSALKLVAAQSRRDAKEALSAILGGEEQKPVVLAVAAKDGRSLYVEVVGRRLYEHGDLVGTFHIARDVTERRTSEKEIRRLKEFNEDIVQNMAEGIAIQDAEGVFTFVNPAASRMLGHAPDELIGQPWTKVIPPDMQPIALAADERRRRGASDRYPLELVRRDGTRFPVLVSGSPRFDPQSGEFAGTLAVFTDTSEQARVEDNLARRAEELEALYEISLEINAQPDLPTLLDAIVRRAANLVGVRVGGLYLPEVTGAYELAVQHGLPETIGGASWQLAGRLAAGAALSGQTEVLEDCQGWADRSGFSGQHPFQRVLCVPLKAGDRVLGVLVLIDDQVSGPFDSHQLRVASLLADQAAIAIENARLLAAERSARNQTEVLVEAARTMNASLDVDGILRAMLDQLGRILVYESASVLVFRDDGTPDLVVGLGYDDTAYTSQEARRLLHRSPILQRMARDLRPIVCGDVRQLEGWIWVPGAERVRSWMAIPLVARGSAIGVLMLDHSAQDFYGQPELQTAQALAQHAAQALLNAKLFEAETTARGHAETLHAATRALSTTLDLRAVLALILRELRRVVPYDSASVQQLRGHRLEIIGGHGFANMESLLGLGFDTRRDDNPNGEVVETRAPLILEDAPERYVGFHREPHAQAKVRAWLGVPLLFGDRVIGMITLDKQEPGFYTNRHARLAMAFAAQAASAIENARLYEEAQQLKAFNENIVQGVAEGMLLEDSEGTIVFANRALEELLGYASGKLEGSNWSCIVPDEETERVRAEFSQRRHGVESRYETRLLDAGGRRIPVMVSARPLFEGGQFAGVLSAFTDISERVRSDQALRQSQTRLRAILSSMADIVFTLDEEGRFTFLHAPDESDLYVAAPDLAGRKHSEVMPAQVHAGFEAAFERNRMGEVAEYEYRHLLEDGSRWFSVKLSPIFLEGRFKGSVAVARDVTERKRAVQELRTANRGLQVLSECNRALSRITDEHELLGEVCRIAVEVGGYLMAWVGYARQDQAHSVEPVAEAGFGEGYLDTLDITWADTERGRGPTGRAIRTLQPVIARNIQTDPGFAPWRDEAARRGYASSIALPIQINGLCVGALNVYAARPEAFDGEEVSLLTELADNLSYGIMALRTRLERRRAQEALRSYAERLEMLHHVDRAILEAASPEAIASAALRRIRQIIPCHEASISAFGLEATRPDILAVQLAADENRKHAGRPREAPAPDLYRAVDDMQSLRAARTLRHRSPTLLPLASPLEPVGSQGKGAGAVEGDAVGSGLHPVDTPHTGGAQPKRWPTDVSIPLMAQGELIGTMHLSTLEKPGFAPEHVEVAYELAAPLAVAIQQARLHERLGRYAGSLEETVAQRTRELRAERDRTQAILESLGDAVVVMDTSGTILYANPATLAQTGYSSDELVGRNWHMWEGDARSAETSGRRFEMLGQGRVWGGEMALRRKDGTLFDAVVSIAPLFDPEDASALIGSVCVLRDITPLKDAERIKDEFVSNVSHELRTPLSVITLVSGNLDTLYDRVGDTKRREMIKSIRQYVSQLNDLIGDVLEISRIDSGILSAEREPIELATLAHGELEKQRPLAGTRMQTIQFRCEESLRIRGNEDQLRQVVRNLLNNAIKFTPEGGQVTCECRALSGGTVTDGSWPGAAALPEGNWAALRVVDTGIGIGPDHQAHIFERFYRVKTETNVPGTGLGLAIAHELVSLHGGYIAVASSPGEGSTFAVYLPLAREES